MGRTIDGKYYTDEEANQLVSGRSFSVGQADDMRNKALQSGLSSAQIDAFLQRDPDDINRVIEAYADDNQPKVIGGPDQVNGVNQAEALGLVGTASSPNGGGAGRYGSTGGGQGQAMANYSGFGATPAPFGETYSTLARPAGLSQPYVPPTWQGGDFQAPSKPGALETPYALPTQAELEASPGYLASQTAMQRGMERSAAAKGTVLSGGFAGRALPRAMGEHASGAYNNLVGQTLGARQQQRGEYQADYGNDFGKYQQKYGQFQDAATLGGQARGINEQAYDADSSRNMSQYLARFNAYQSGVGNKRNSESDLWARNQGMVDNSLRAAALARPY
jgi:hypothetical protein